MKHRIVYIALLLFATGFYCQAQKETNWWFFGQGNSLNFNIPLTVNDSQGRPTDGMPTAGTGNITTDEGCFTLSDSDGNLMMYSDGMTIWDASGVAMPNGSGLLGGSSSTQSGIIVPYPGSPGKYYAISVAQEKITNGITYSVVDMTLPGNGTVNSPLGDVVAGEKNRTLRAGPIDENVTAVKKTGSDNYWIIHRNIVAGNAGTIYVWELSASGFSSPVTYTATLPYTAETYLGYIKFSSDGTKFVSPIWNLAIASLFVISGEFNPATGQISGITFRSVFNYSQAYSVEFSLSGDHLYLTRSNSALYHITWNDLRNTGATATDLNLPISNIQMNSDGRIYGINGHSRNLYVIMNPEEGANADIRTFTDYLFATGKYGLPSFAASYLNIKMEGEQSFCAHSAQTFTLQITGATGTSTLSHTEWNFGDGSAVVPDNNVTNGTTQSQTHTYTKPGNYTITVNSYLASDGSLAGTETFNVTVNPCVLPVNPNIHMY